VIFREFPEYKPNLTDHTFFDITETRDVIMLNGKWSVFSANDGDENKVNITVPSIFEGEGEFIFEREFQLSESDLFTSSFDLIFFGLNYRADISINDIIIYRHTGGEFPFKIELSKDILLSESANVLSVHLFYKLDSKNTIPLKQRFLYSNNRGGIFRDVYIHKKPSVNISSLNLNCNFDADADKTTLDLRTIVINQGQLIGGELQEPLNLTLKAMIASPDSAYIIELREYSFQLDRNKELAIEQSREIRKPILWSSESPESYYVRIELWKEDLLIDVINRSVAVYRLKVSDSSLTFNGNSFKLNGVVYTPEFESYGGLMNYKQFEDDIRLIKNAGFNSIRIAKTVPHPYCLALCEKYGLLAFIELPIGMLPEKITQDQNFVVRCRNFLTSYINSFEKFSAVAGVGLGRSYLTSIDAHRSLLINLGELIKDNTNWVSYASFGNLDIQVLENIDLYGLELLNILPANYQDEIISLQNLIGQGKIFISEAAYTVNRGNSDGYVNKYTYEAQAKYFADLIDYSRINPLSGYFINSITDIRGDYSSLLSGYSVENMYNIGIVDESRSTNRLGYKVVSSKLNNTEKVTIPIGSVKDDAPMIFILFGLALALLMGVLVNSGRKFREDASRALLRPFNFFSDVRDQRIMSAYHTTFLAFIVVVVQALIISNILFYFKTNIVFEKLLLSFGSPVILSVVNYLCWHPFNTIVWISVIGIMALLITALLIRVGSLFVRTRIYLSSIYFTIVWAFLPMVFLIPLGIVLYRVLVADILNVYVFLSLFVLSVWVLYRLLKGVYVIYDSSSGGIYFYGILFIMFIASGILLYFEINNYTIQYLFFTLKQYGILG
jgi:beta-galactosidase